MKVPFVISVDTESLLEKIDTCYSNPEESPTTKVSKHTACVCSLFILCSFNSNKKDMITIEEKNAKLLLKTKRIRSKNN